MPTSARSAVLRCRIGAVVVAAGRGARLGGVAKALVRGKDGRAFLASILTSARQVGLAEAIVVVGPPHGAEVAACARDLGAHVVDNPQPERGMASSVALGFAAVARTGCEAAWLWPVDHPDVTPATLRVLVGALAHHAGARPIVDGRGGHPPLVSRALFEALAACGGVEGGARSVLAAADVVDVPVDDRGCVRDIDTWADREAR